MREEIPLREGRQNPGRYSLVSVNIARPPNPAHRAAGAPPADSVCRALHENYGLLGGRAYLRVDIRT